MAAKKLKPAKKKVASPTSAKKKSRGGTEPKKSTPKAGKRSLVPNKKKAARAAKAVEEPMAPAVLPIPTATFIF